MPVSRRKTRAAAIHWLVQRAVGKVQLKIDHPQTIAANTHD